MKKRLKNGCVGLFLFATLFLLSCSSGSSVVSYLSLKSADSDTFTISDVTEEQKYILIPFAAPSKSNGQDPSGELSYSLTFSTNGTATKTFDFDPVPKAKGIEKNADDELLPKRYEDQFAIDKERHQKTLRLIDEINAEIKDKPIGYFNTHYKRDLGPAFKTMDINPALSNTIEVKYTLNGATRTVTGTLRNEGTNCAVYVDTRDTVRDEDIEAVMNTFDNVSYKRVRAFWGEESDIDSNGKVLIFLTDIMTHEGIGVVGFFQPVDLVPADYPDCTECVNSNEMEIIFSTYPWAGQEGDAGNPEVTPEIYEELVDATLSHEFFHLVNFVEKTMNAFYGGSGVSESLFLNEGMAHLSEDITGNGFDAFYTAGFYLDYTAMASIGGNVDSAFQQYGGLDANDTLYRRAATMLFLRYLFERKGGATYSTEDAGEVSGGGVDFLRNLNRSSNTGVHNIEATFGESFESLVRQWVAALYLDGTGLNDEEKFNYDPEEDDSFTNQVRGFNLRGSRVMPTGTTIQHYGPDITRVLTTQWGVQNFNDTVFDSGCELFQLNVSPLNEMKITMSGTKGQGLGMTIVRIQ